MSSPEHTPTNEISVQWGRFKLAIVGPVALITTLGIVLALSFGRDITPLLCRLFGFACA